MLLTTMPAFLSGWSDWMQSGQPASNYAGIFQKRLLMSPDHFKEPAGKRPPLNHLTCLRAPRAPLHSDD